MRYSVYPTDPDAVRDAVLAQAGAGARLFTSLHIPEADGLTAYVDWLRDVAQGTGATFVADVSPAAFTRLGWRLDDPRPYADAGIVGVRLDFGLSSDEARALHDGAGVEIAVNASTVTAAELDDLADLSPTGWHNYYPRPETGLDPAFLAAQNALFDERGLPLCAFVPGESTFRAPLHLGLPTLERHRGRPAYVAAVDLASLCPAMTLYCAEGVLRDDHAAWLDHREQTGEITLPLVGVAPRMEYLFEQPWRIRVEQTGLSQRLEGTRGQAVPAPGLNAATRMRGSVQVDTDRYGRYAGEVHLMTVDRPLDAGCVRAADIAAPYVDLVDCLHGGELVRFVRG